MLTGKKAAAIDYFVKRYVDQGEENWGGPTSGAQATFERYCELFGLNEDSFQDQIVIDIGCGPQGSLHYFRARLKFGIDVVARYYSAFGSVQQDMIWVCFK